MKSQRKLPVLAATAVLMLAITACSGNTPAEAPIEPSSTASPSPAQSTASPSPSPSTEPSSSSATEPSSSPAQEAKMIHGTGIYVGQIDNHSVEIKTEEGATSFELGAGLEQSLETLNMDDPVVFEYAQRSVEGDSSISQRVLSKLEKSAESGSAAPSTGRLAKTKTLKLTLEGMEEEKTATLATGAGYSLYVFDIFTFDAKTGKLAMKVDPGYYAEITKLPSDFNLDALQLEGEEELASTGKVTALGQKERDQRMTGIRLYLTAMGSDLTREYVVKEMDGQGYVIKLNIPQREASEGFGPHVYASLDSMVSR
ncbi:hypothetical protein [Paenibacillus sp. P32E]|uniref:hypothetical protein n=1 Tax=Paenibacillus sp. P32E TaxID=1349434 RepID=UPI000939347B|nr:hypothetical protein [Paenibacillus sp. P32E]OKP93330.1 hypothetical protein A3848_04970 [Paenibacillus sp. P32E]